MRYQDLHDRQDQNFWNFIFSILFIIFVGALIMILYCVRGALPTSISLADAIIISLASFRVVRLFVYDKITRFIRDFFFKIDESYTEEGVTYFEHREFARGWRRTMSDLLACPWCFSIWAASVVTFFYYLTAYAWLPIFMLAISGAASFFQITSNMVGWNAEKRKLEAKRLEKEEK
jgi:hypothetical protein